MLIPNHRMTRKKLKSIKRLFDEIWSDWKSKFLSPLLVFRYQQRNGDDSFHQRSEMKSKHRINEHFLQDHL